MGSKDTENRKTIEKTNETKRGFFDKDDKTDKPLVRQMRTKEKTQITNRNEKGDITIDSTDIKMIRE